MAAHILIGARKGLFVLQKDFAGNWQIADIHFLGDPVIKDCGRWINPSLAK